MAIIDGIDVDIRLILLLLLLLGMKIYIPDIYVLHEYMIIIYIAT